MTIPKALRALHLRKARPSQARPTQLHDHGWLQRWMQTTADLANLQYSHRMVDAVIDEIDGRQIRIGEQWLTDFASCNYLGLDLDPGIIAAVPEYLARWGTHPSWSRLLGSPALYEELEDRLTDLLGAEDTLLLPTVSLIHLSVLPILAGGGTLFLDSRAHKTIYDGCSLSVARGATIERFRHNDLDQLDALLRGNWRRPGVICIDGINSMTGNPPDLHTLAALARRHDALLYVDDAHGFGVIGERSGDELCSYGARGNSIVRHFGESYDNVDPRRRPLEVVLVAARVRRLPVGDQAGAEDHGATVPLLRAVPDRLAGDGQRGPPSQRPARRAAARADLRADRARARQARRARHGNAQPIRVSDHRDTAPRSRHASTRSATCCFTAAST